MPRPNMKPLQQLIQAVTSAVSGAAPPIHVPVDITPEWLLPISEVEPSGPNLEYDPEYAVLAARLQPKADVQYGDFAAQAPEPDWKDIERDCRRLLLRSKDIGMLIWFARSRTHQAGAQGLLQGLGALQQVCERFAASVHPQLHIDGEFDPLVQANTLAALCDAQGLLEDVRDVVVSSSTAFRLSVRDIERSLSVPRPPYAPEPEAVQRQLADLHQRRDPQMQALQGCAMCVQQLQAWSVQHLGEEAPDLQPLLKLLSPLLAKGGAAPIVSPTPHASIEPVEGHAMSASFNPALAQASTGTLMAVPGSQAMPAPTLQGNVTDQREQVRQSLAQVRQWIELHEPSSPVSVLLKQAERMWGKRFSEVAHIIPAELLQAWDQDQ